MLHGLFVFFLFLLFGQQALLHAKQDQNMMTSATWSLLFVRSTLRYLFNRALAATCSLLLCSLYASSLERSCDVSLIEMSLAERQELPRQGKTIYIVSFFSGPGSKTENGNNPFKLSGS